MSLFRRYLFTLVSIMVTCIVLGMLASILVIEAERNGERTQSERNRLRPSPWTFTARMIDELIRRERVTADDALAAVGTAHGSRADIHLALGDADAAAAALSDNVGAARDLPDEPYRAAIIRPERFRPPRGEVVRLSEPGRFLIVRLDPGVMGGPGGGPPGRPGFMGPPGLFWTNFVALVGSVILAAIVALLLLFRSMRARARLADDVLGQMRAGNLKVRFPVKAMDEVGQLMQKFNLMADEIERLVERLQDTELRRTRLLQQLAHDLRTPVASLKNFTEMLHLRFDVLKTEDRRELISLSLKEIEYVERLVEDLLFLAQVTEPKYRAGSERVNLTELLDEELASVGARFREPPRAVEPVRDYPDGVITVNGDPYLLRRLIRNALENAFSFASARVRVRLGVTAEGIVVEILDDGPGLDAAALAGFGERRATRVLSERPNGRISVGLGSVIMKAVASAHGGQVHVTNGEGTERGARVKVTLPIG